MALTDLTTTASIRAVLGVSEKEIKDVVLTNPVYVTRLNEEIYSLHSGLMAAYVTARDVTPPRAANQQRLFDLVQLYCAYFVANICAGGAIDMFAPVTIKDARSELTRAADPYSQLRADLAASMPLIRNQLLAVYALINTSYTKPVKTVRTLVLGVPLGTDPVIG